MAVGGNFTGVQKGKNGSRRPLAGPWQPSLPPVTGTVRPSILTAGVKDLTRHCGR